MDVVDVYRALAYYHENPEEMAEIQARREQRHEDATDDPNVAISTADLHRADEEGSFSYCSTKTQSGS